MASNTNSVRFSIKGIEQISKKLREVSDDVIKDSTRPAVRRAMQVVKRSAEARAQRNDNPRTPPDISDHIGLRTRWDKQSRTMTGRVGVMGGANYRKGDKDRGEVTYWRYVELGTGRSRARPFLRPALANNTEQVLQSVADEIKAQLDRRV